MPGFERHLFICTNVRPADHPRGSCSACGGELLRDLFKEAVARRGLKGTVRANASGCLDQCEHGPTVVVYPEGVWYGFVTPDDVDEIVQKHLVEGEPVARLRLPDPCLNTRSCPHKPRPTPQEGPKP